MFQELIVKNILRQFKINKKYRGYDYIIHAVGLMFFNERFIDCMTKVLYITIGQNFETNSVCVERNIRKVIEVIWDNTENIELIEKYFGASYIYYKPSNREFLCLLYDYVESYNLVIEIFDLKESTCPISQSPCSICMNIVNCFRNMF